MAIRTLTVGLFLGCLTLCASMVQARTPSLFFMQEERAHIDREIQKNPPDASSRAKHILHLGSIIYFGPENWSIWVQGEKWTATTEQRDIKVLAVTQNEVHLSVKLRSGRLMPHVLLHPHQSLNLLTGQVIEGL